MGAPRNYYVIDCTCSVLRCVLWALLGTTMLVSRAASRVLIWVGLEFDLERFDPSAIYLKSYEGKKSNIKVLSLDSFLGEA